MQEMQSLNEVEEVFFDSVESLLLEEPAFVEKKSGYDLWLEEPESVKTRRENFLHEMGFVEFDCLPSVVSDESDSMGLNRITESSGAVCSSASEEDFMCNVRESSGSANSSADELDQIWFDDVAEVSSSGCTVHSPDGEHTCFDATSDPTHGKDSKSKNQKMKKWWKQFSQKMRKSQSTDVSKVFTEKQKVTPMEVHLNRKRFKEFSAVYCGQEISAHNGLIWTMKFSPDGKYLASGGEDGVVRIWLVTVDSSCESPEFNFSSHRIKGKLGHKKNKSCYTPVIVPEKVFKIDESPLHEFHGHTAGILDIAWSSSNVSHLLTAFCITCLLAMKLNGILKCSVFYHHPKIKLFVYGKSVWMDVMEFFITKTMVNIRSFNLNGFELLLCVTVLLDVLQFHYVVDS